MPSKSQDFEKDKVVEKYRDLLNDFYRMINRMNQSVDNMSQEKEVLKLRLLNVYLKQQVHKMKQEQSQLITRQMIQEILDKHSTEEVPKEVRSIVALLEQLHFHISRDQFKLN